MKRFLIHLFAFLAPLFLLLFIIPINERMFYKNLSEDCMNKSVWVYDRIFNNPKSTDIVFLGSSHTINGIDDALIEKQISETSLNVVNLGYCRIGTNLEYILLKRITSVKNVKALVIEVREDEARFGHPIFPYLASSAEVFSSPVFINNSLFDDYYKHCYYRLEIMRNIVFQRTIHDSINLSPFGFSASMDTASSDFLSEIGSGRDKETRRAEGIEKEIVYNYSFTYLNKITSLCKQKKIKLYFLYMPGFGNGNKEPGSLKGYQKLGTVLLPPNEILSNKNYWHDEDHLNQTGSTMLSTWVATQIKTAITSN